MVVYYRGKLITCMIFFLTPNAEFFEIIKKDFIINSIYSLFLKIILLFPILNVLLIFKKNENWPMSKKKILVFTQKIKTLIQRMFGYGVKLHDIFLPFFDSFKQDST